MEDRWNRINNSDLRRLLFSYPLLSQGYRDTYSDSLPSRFMDSNTFGMTPGRKYKLADDLRDNAYKSDYDRSLPFELFQRMMRHSTDTWKMNNRDNLLKNEGLLAPWNMNRLEGMPPGVMY